MDDGWIDEHERRVIKNEQLFRQVNERIEELARDLVVEEASEFVCECGEPGCRAPIRMTRAEYEAIRAEPTHFAIVPGHEHRDFEFVVSKNERFAVIEKFGEGGQVAEAADPRS